MDVKRACKAIRLAAVLFCVAVVLVGMNPVTLVAFDELECAEALEDYRQAITKFMAKNRKYQALLQQKAQELKVSARKYDEVEDDITLFLKDGEISRAEAKKFSKMNEKAWRIYEAVRDISNASAKMKKREVKVSDLYDEAFQKCK